MGKEVIGWTSIQSQRGQRRQNDASNGQTIMCPMVSFLDCEKTACTAELLQCEQQEVAIKSFLDNNKFNTDKEEMNKSRNRTYRIRKNVAGR